MTRDERLRAAANIVRIVADAEHEKRTEFYRAVADWLELAAVDYNPIARDLYQLRHQAHALAVADAVLGPEGDQ